MSDAADHRRAAVEDAIGIINRLAQYYETPEEAVAWLVAAQPLLQGATAIELLAAGRADELHRLLDQLDSAVYL